MHSSFLLILGSPVFSSFSQDISRRSRAWECGWLQNQGGKNRIQDCQDRQILRVPGYFFVLVFFFFCCRNKRPRVRSRTCPSVRGQSAIQCNRLEQKCIRALRWGHHCDGTKEAAAASATLPSRSSSAFRISVLAVSFIISILFPFASVDIINQTKLLLLYTQNSQ